MYDSNSNRGRVCSAGTGARLCDFITLHANFDRGWPRRWKTEVEEPERDGACAGNG